MMLVDTDADPGLWFHMPLRLGKSEFAEWLDLQLEATGLLHQRKLTWREKRQMKKFLEGSAAMLGHRVEADQAFLFGPMPPAGGPAGVLRRAVRLRRGAQRTAPEHAGGA
ncbi:hypothetical protein LV779_13035 [Streptomyces thinghirensis]|nr:hypothetical protein [Streptomyces thinghirensis]